MEPVARFSTKVVAALELEIESETPIYLGATNISHMQSRHPEAYGKYGAMIPLILAEPDYAAVNQADGSIEFVKEFVADEADGEYVKVAVRISAAGRFYARSLYVLNSGRVVRFIARGTLKKI